MTRLLLPLEPKIVDAEGFLARLDDSLAAPIPEAPTVGRLAVMNPKETSDGP